MKKIFIVVFIHLWITFSFFAVFAQNFRTVRDGIEYAEFEKEIDNGTIKMNLLRLDLTKVRLDVVHALDAAIGLEKTSSMAARHGALAAINGGFFRIDKSIFEGDNVAALQIDGKVLSESGADRIALFIANSPQQTTVNINHLNLKGFLNLNKKSFYSIGINRERTENDLVVYTPEFHRSTLTATKGIEIVVRNGKVADIFDGSGSRPIPADGFVISASGKRREEILAAAVVKVGAAASYMFSQINFGEGLTDNPEDAAPSVTTAEDVISGVPLLVRNGKIKITWEREKSSRSFVETRHPRTAVAKLRDGKFLLMTVDGRSDQSSGIGLENLAKILLELGAKDALNLDGGGSTTMFLDGVIVNKPSDKEGERKVGDAILVTPRK